MSNHFLTLLVTGLLVFSAHARAYSPPSLPCNDEPDWVVNATTDLLRPFKGLNCNALEELLVSDGNVGNSAWCNFHRMNTDVGKSAAEACCFCGGGSDVPEPCVDTQDWSLDESGVDDTITCNFISTYVLDPLAFCDRIRDVSGFKGQAAFDACCVCGGGYRPYMEFAEIFPTGVSSPSPTVGTTSPTIDNERSTDRSTSPSTIPLGCDGNGVATQIAIEIHTDKFPTETTWKVVNKATNEELFTGEYTDEEAEVAIATRTHFLCSKGCYQFVLSDASGDGFVDPGRYRVLYDNSVITEGNGNFGYNTTTYPFGEGCPIIPMKQEVSCGNKTVPTCADCPQGIELYCNGDCEWDSTSNSCLSRVDGNPKRRLHNQSKPGVFYEDTRSHRDLASYGDEGTCSPVRDITSREGLGESPGIPNVEYLGLGYDGLRGNPRGTANSQIDPGFKAPVLALNQNQNVLTVDGDFTIPIGTNVKYTSSCHYDSQSTEISTEEDLIADLSTEAQMTNRDSKSSLTETQDTTDLSVSAFGFGFEGEKSRSTSKSQYKSQAFGKSEEVLKFRSTSTGESSVTYEAKAVCSEFEVEFNPYYIEQYSEMDGVPPLLHPIFKAAIDLLPLKYNKDNIDQMIIYKKFLQTYGTHYVSKLVLGAKRILSSKISSRSVQELIMDGIDISATMSLEMQRAISSTHSMRIGFSATAELKQGTVSGGAGQGNSNSQSNEEENDYFNFSRNNKQAESAKSIATKDITTSEINVGGLPNEDWREWAASAKEKPMPISYELVGIWTLMGNKADAFSDAFMDIEGIALIPIVDNTVLDATHFGVSTGSGEPISSYKFLQDAGYNALLSVGDPEMMKENGVITNGVIKYTTQWKGKPNIPTAFFATAIRGDVGTNEMEEKQMGATNPYLYGSEFDFHNNILYGISDDRHTCGTTAIARFYEEQRIGPSHSFSFLSIEDRMENHKDFIVGIVANDASILNKGSEHAFEVKKSGAVDFEVTLKTPNPTQKPKYPIIIAFPHWYRDGNGTEQFPPDIGHMALAVRRPSLNPSLIPSRYSIMEEGTNECGDGYKQLTTAMECEAYAVYSETPYGSTGSYNNVPSGCSLYLGYLYFNTYSGGIINDGTAAPICEPVSSDYPLDSKFTVAVGSHAKYDYSSCTEGIEASCLRAKGRNFSKQLGMNFIAFDQNFDNEYMRVGFVGEYDGVTDNTMYSGPGWVAIQEAERIDTRGDVFTQHPDTGVDFYSIPNFKNEGSIFSTERWNGVVGTLGGVRINFSKAFDDVPAVIVTPVLSEGGESCSHRGYRGSERGPYREFNYSPSFFAVPHCVVETITKQSIFVKCACISSNSGYEGDRISIEYAQLPFNFLAIGPSAVKEPTCSMKWCTSIAGKGGNDCWAGTVDEGCTCSTGTASLTGNTQLRNDFLFYEYTCCTDGTGIGEECGTFVN